MGGAVVGGAVVGGAVVGGAVVGGAVVGGAVVGGAVVGGAVPVTRNVAARSFQWSSPLQPSPNTPTLTVYVPPAAPAGDDHTGR